MDFLNNKCVTNQTLLSSNPLTTTRYKNAGQLWEFLTTLFLYGLHCKFYTGEPCLSAVYSKKQNQFIIYITHFRSVYVPKSRFFGINAVHCSGALLKKRKRFFLYFLNGYRYRNNFNRFEFQALKAIFSTIFNILVTTGEKKSMQKHFIF